MSNVIRGLMNLHSRVKQTCAVAIYNSTERHGAIDSTDKEGSGPSKLLAENHNRRLDWYQAIHGPES